MAPTTPKALHWSYALAVLNAIGLVIFGLVVISQNHYAPDFVLQYQRFLGFSNIIGGVVVASLSAQFQQLGLITRRVYTAVAVLMALVNLLGVVLAHGGLIFVLLAVSLVSSALLLFQHSVTAFCMRPMP